jgi:hypothetical protein
LKYVEQIGAESAATEGAEQRISAWDNLHGWMDLHQAPVESHRSASGRFTFESTDWCLISGMSQRGTYKALARGDLTAVKNGNRTLVNVEAGLAWLQTLPSAQIHAPKSETEDAA